MYFAERKQSLGYDWHPECLRCEECGKRLDPGQHAEHKGVPYCHVPCYGALFGPQLFGHGTRVESHKSFGQKGSPRVGTGPPLPRSHLESKLKVFNQFYDGKSTEIKSREVNGRLVLEGALRIYWGVQGVIHLKEDDDQRTVVTVRKRNSCRLGNGIDIDDDDDLNGAEVDHDSESLGDTSVSDTGIESGSDCTDVSSTTSHSSPSHDISCKSNTLPPKLDVRSLDWDELDDLLQVERKVEDADKLYQTMPVPLPSQSSCDKTDGELNIDKVNGSRVETAVDECIKEQSAQKCNKELPNRSFSQDDSWIEKSLLLNRSMSGPDCLERIRTADSSDCEDASSISGDSGNQNDSMSSDTSVVLRRAVKTGSTAIKRRPGKRRSRTKLKRRCSINGHFYNRETSFFTPPHGSQMSVWVTSLVNTYEVINLLLEKYKVDSKPANFALFVVRDNGEQRRLRDEEYPLLVRVLLGPHEDVAKLFIMDRHTTPEVSNEVAQFLNLSLAECRAILEQYRAEEEREVFRVQEKYREMRIRIKKRMDDLKVRL